MSALPATRPPRLPERLLELLLPPQEREAVLGDLAEEYAERLADAASADAAGRWYWRQVLESLPPALSLRVRRRRDRRLVRSIERHTRENLMQTWLQDVRYAVRLMVRSPGLTASVVLTLGLGIAGSTAVFAAVDGIVLNPFPFPAPERLVGIGPEFPRLGQQLGFREVLSPAEFLDIREGSRSLVGEVAWDMGNRQVTVGETTENLRTAFWWGDAFATLAVRPTLGRGFLPSEVERGDPVAVLSHRVWKSQLAGDADVVGRVVRVNGVPHTVVGVMPPRALVYGSDLWLPMPVSPHLLPREARQFQILARLAPGSTLEEAQVELEAIARRVEREHARAFPEYEGWRLQAMTWNDVNVGSLKPAGQLLMWAVGFVLLLVCANVATLLLARATGRRKELAVRTALGAARGRLLRQLLTESVLLALAGGLLGAGMAWLAIGALGSAVVSLGLPVPGDVVLNGRVLSFAAAVSVGAGILFGILPALQAARPAVSEELKAEGGGATGDARRLRLQRTLVGVEVALAVVLLVAGGLLVKSLVELHAVSPGLDTRDVLTMRLSLPRERYRPEDFDPFFRELVRRVEEIPGVAGAATATQLPPGVFLQRELQIEGRPSSAAGTLPTAYATIGSPAIFRTLGVPLRRGRVFTEEDRAGAPPVVVLNEVAAERYFPGVDPLGKRLRLGGGEAEGPWLEVVGVVGATRNRGLDVAPEPEIFASSRQLGEADNQHFLVVRTRTDPHGVLAAVRREVQALDSQQPVYMIRTLDEAFALADAPRRLSTVVLGLFAGFALVLAALGIYGVVSYTVGRRRRELGVRLALGASGRQVRWLVVRQAALPVAIGAAAGMVGAVVLGRAMAGMLYRVSGSDPATLAVVVVVLGSVALLASYLPARRISELDPTAALRQERG